ncbi:MAG: formate hydrogenlyase [Rhodanobacter sp.]|nr:MAG: formate hydrogenlyase [Rhodanobacter sp.]TAM02423.1 MAG: formate hydrogenlyase [Rhodanobacter sp.]TAM41084.1 MAG: formate hydrogenlyase [Rhodanobacter sp.]TAN25928.1 MAG: formate hydrogenlyase [Rhodanobacter sp.]
MFDILSRILRVGRLSEALPAPNPAGPELTTIQRELHAVFGRALCIRHVDAGSCNGCELEIHALSTAYYNLEGAGVRFVASPRHADLLLVTGPVSVNMEEALKLTYAAMPEPKWVLAVGDCGGCGGVFGANYATRGPISDVIPVDAVVGGCPPSPLAILQGLVQITRHLAA